MARHGLLGTGSRINEDVVAAAMSVHDAPFLLQFSHEIAPLHKTISFVS
jgi:hypothetical protein